MDFAQLDPLVHGLSVAVQGPVAMAWRDVGLLSLASVFLSTGYFAVIAATRHAELSVVAPFRYVGLLWALLLGWVFWGDVPNLLAQAGMACLVVAGLTWLGSPDYIQLMWTTKAGMIGLGICVSIMGFGMFIMRKNTGMFCGPVAIAP